MTRRGGSLMALAAFVVTDAMLIVLAIRAPTATVPATPGVTVTVTVTQTVGGPLDATPVPP